MKHSKKSHKEGRGSFSGRIGYVLAVAGSAVGLETSGVFHTLLQNMEEESFF